MRLDTHGTINYRLFIQGDQANRHCNINMSKTDIVDILRGFGCHGNHFVRKLYGTIITKIGILLNWLSGAEYRVYTTVIHHWKAEVVSILMRCVVFVYLVY